MELTGDEKLLEVGANIRKWRDLKGMKQESLAEELDISPVAISKIETGKTNIPLKRLFAIATALNINVELLFTDPSTIIQQIKNKTEKENITKSQSS
ncbi:MAG TPA: helix-turn-helix transcriptional regulator [Chitinophagaceae bacterium]|jgi:transcriptional regulator with XRE-family HTH domain|nr:helix-turn-helix transcriptional regulator [Chitinophagaceae bacterium]